MPDKMATRSFACDTCGVGYTLTVIADGCDEAALAVKFQMLAASLQSLLEDDGVFWCETHRPYRSHKQTPLFGGMTW